MRKFLIGFAVAGALPAYVIFNVIATLIIFTDDYSSSAELAKFAGNAITSANIASVFTAVIWIFALGFQRLAGFTFQFNRYLWLGLIPLYIVIVNLVQADHAALQLIPASEYGTQFLGSLLSGFTEEVIFRSVIFAGMLAILGTNRGNIISALVVSLLLFNSAFILNLVMRGADLALIAQMITETIFGLFFAVVLLRTGNILVVGFMHGVINFTAWMQHKSLGTAHTESLSLSEFTFEVLLMVPLLIAAIVILKTVPSDETNSVARTRKKGIFTDRVAGSA